MKLENVSSTFPPGTTVGAYASARFDSGQPSPIGPQLDSAVVDVDGSLTFTELVEDGTTYVAAAQFGEDQQWRILRFTTDAPEDLTAGQVSEALETHAADTTSVHGIDDTDALALKVEVEEKQDADTAATDEELAATAKGVCIYDAVGEEWPERPPYASVEFQSPEGAEEPPEAVDGDTWLEV